MRVVARLTCRGSAALLALLLVAGVVVCLAHADTGDASDLCIGFGPTIGPVTHLPLATLGHADPAPVALYQAVPADLTAPPPEA
jgi:hypothetical protein